MTLNASQFEVHPSSGVPIYLQIKEQVNALIVGGHLNEGDMLPSVRDMAAELGVNHMTISKAYSRLEASGVVERVRGRGMKVLKPQTQGSTKARQQEIQPLIEQAIVRARQLGLSDSEILDVYQQVLRKYREE